MSLNAQWTLVLLGVCYGQLHNHWLGLMSLGQMEKEHGSEDTADVTPGNRAVSSGDELINPPYAQRWGNNESEGTHSPLCLQPIAKEQVTTRVRVI